MKLDVDQWVKGVDIMQDCESCSDPCVTGVQTASTTVTSVGSGRRRNLSENYSKLNNFLPVLVSDSDPRIQSLTRAYSPGLNFFECSCPYFLFTDPNPAFFKILIRTLRLKTHFQTKYFKSSLFFVSLFWTADPRKKIDNLKKIIFLDVLLIPSCNIRGKFLHLDPDPSLNTGPDPATQMNTDPFRIAVINSIIKRFSFKWLAYVL